MRGGSRYLDVGVDESVWQSIAVYTCSYPRSPLSGRTKMSNSQRM